MNNKKKQNDINIIFIIFRIETSGLAVVVPHYQPLPLGVVDQA